MTQLTDQDLEDFGWYILLDNWLVDVGTMYKSPTYLLVRIITGVKPE